MKRWYLAGLPVALGIVLLAPASPASAHPMGNFSVNQYAGLTLHPDRVDVSVAVDYAEIPTLQQQSTMDSARECRTVADQFEVSVDGHRLQWMVSANALAYRPGSGGLRTSRLTCSLDGATRLRDDTVEVVNRYRVDRVGWREMTAVSDGVRLVDSPLPVRSVTDELRAYPQDLLSSALDQRTATLRVAPGSGGAGATVAKPGSDPLTRWSTNADSAFQRIAGGRLTPLVGVLAVLLAVLLGAGHAALPGHGKTVLAAYLAGRRGSIRDALAVGATVTLTHTGGVLVVGLLLSTSTALAGERLLSWLGLASGLLVAAVGVGMLVGVARRRRHEHQHAHGHGHDHHHHEHGGGKLGLAGIGLAGGLVPSPSALVVLLGAIGLGRAGFGVLLVLAYGLGMAGTLTAAGLLLLAVQRRVARGRLAARLAPLATRLRAAASTGTAALVVLVGLGLTLRALAGAV